MVHVLKKVEEFYILLLTLEAKQQKDTLRHTACQKSTPNESISGVPFDSWPSGPVPDL